LAGKDKRGKLASLFRTFVRIKLLHLYAFTSGKDMLPMAAKTEQNEGKRDKKKQI
jgi:hypothetical protein